MSRRIYIVAALFAICAPAATLFAQTPASSTDETLPARKRYLPQYDAAGELMLPKNYREWVYVGSPLTPNALNDGHAAFPEFHNVFIEPVSYAIYKKTGVFPEGTIFYKELELTLKPEENADGSRTEPSGRGYFPGAAAGAELAVKDTKRFAESGGWGYFDFKPTFATAAVKLRTECAYCHIGTGSDTPHAKRDLVWTQFYPALDEVPLPK
jgi:hypothetical protein